MTPTTSLVARQLWQLPTPSSSIAIPHCTPLTLPSGGLLAINNVTVTLTADTLFTPYCSGEDFSATADGSPAAFENSRDPFYASVTPQVYVIAATTVIAWILVLMLIITPRTSFSGGPAAQPGFGLGHGIIGGAHGGSTLLIGVGSRPWLQKAAALTVAISLTLATADTFRVARDQYNIGYMDALGMREEVLGSLEIRITRVVSDVFVWLAQVQTLIRLFPRHREKVLIKWIGFGLIICDTTFSCLNAFLVNTSRAPRYFVDAIPALSYLFELALSLLYAAWVIYYAITKRRYAFYHTKMRSISLIALLSLVAILTPVVFFITDVSNTDVASWGDYFRWVGAAAASVVVWEWVERIEAVERDEKKDGILGREIYDDDDFPGDLDGDDYVVTSIARRRDDRRRSRPNNDRLEAGITSEKPPSPGPGRSQSTQDYDFHDHAVEDGFSQLPERRIAGEPVTSGIARPHPVASPVSRTDTSSAVSTVYVVRQEAAADVPQPIRRRPEVTGNVFHGTQRPSSLRRPESPVEDEKAAEMAVQEPGEVPSHAPQGRWLTVNNPFKRKRASPPVEVQQAQRQAMTASYMARAATPKHNFSRWDIKNRFGVLAADAGDMFWQKVGNKETERQFGEGNLIVIPAQPRGSGRTWSPAALETNAAASSSTGTSSSRLRHDSEQTDGSAYREPE